jgi:nicotinate-nucleotide adenylyltransferase
LRFLAGRKALEQRAFRPAWLAILACMGFRRIGFFGGSFDPPHRGHLAVARAAAESFELERVLLAPTAKQPLKPEGPVASFADRLEMVKLLGTGVAGFQASAIDAPAAEGLPNYTVDTLRRLHSGLAEGDNIFVIVGVDAFLELQRWRQPEELLKAAEWIVVTRPGFAPERLAELELNEQQRERVHLLDGLAEEVSATQVREALREGLDCEALLPSAVLNYIRQRHLYGA